MSEEISILEMSDEDVLNTPYSTLVNSNKDADEHTEDTEKESEVDNEEQDHLDTDEDSNNDSGLFDDDSSTDSNENTNTDNEDSDTTDTEESKEETTVDYKEAYEKIFKPFKANGKEIAVNTPEEAIQLMQMGANYNKKMAGIKEQLPYLKMLEKNNLLDNDKLSYAIDLLNGDQRAIAKLVKEHELDLFDIEEDETYAPSDKSVSKQELEFNEVVDNLRSSEYFEETINIVTKVMDDSSKEFIVNNPGILNVFDQHLEAGIYNTIWNEVERRIATGTSLNGLTTLEAYKVVGDDLNSQGKLTGSIPENKEDIKKQKEEELKRKRQVASKPKNNPNQKQKTNTINPLEMSDEEFAKLSGMSHLR